MAGPSRSKGEKSTESPEFPQAPIEESKSAPEDSKASGSNISQSSQGSILDDYADPKDEPADYMGGDD